MPSYIRHRRSLPIGDVIRAGMSFEHVERAVTDALRRGMVSESDLEAEAAGRGGRVARVVFAALDEWRSR